MSSITYYLFGLGFLGISILLFIDSDKSDKSDKIERKLQRLFGIFTASFSLFCSICILFLGIING